MSLVEEILVPDIGDFDSVEIIEILVSVGDHLDVDDALITLESDKASMDVPTSKSGTVKEIKVAVGQSKYFLFKSGYYWTRLEIGNCR